MTPMASLRIACIFGTRPEAIKMAPLIYQLNQDQSIETIVAVTAQHREMLDQVLDLFSIQPQADLNLMVPGQTLHELTARVVTGVEGILKKYRPDLVIVQGDTTTCFAAALAAFYQQIPVAHLEAGLRTYERYSPFPEEINRVLTSHLATYHFAPTIQARQNLLDEGIHNERIWVTGNTVVDALHRVKTQVDAHPERRFQWLEETTRAFLNDSDLPLIVVTGHRRESFGEGFANICSAIRHLAQQHPDWLFVYPVHLNPNVQGPVNAALHDQHNVALLSPLPYLSFIELLTRATLVLTDSGGVQEEALSFGKPILIMRDSTERMEAVNAGFARLTGTDTHQIISEVNRIMTDSELYHRMCCSENPYGDGQASSRIHDILKTELMMH